MNPKVYALTIKNASFSTRGFLGSMAKYFLPSSNCKDEFSLPSGSGYRLHYS